MKSIDSSQEAQARFGRWSHAALLALVLATMVLLASKLGTQAPIDLKGPVVASAQSPQLASENVRFIAIDIAGTTWFRYAHRDGSSDRILAIDRDGIRRNFADLRATVESEYELLLRRGSLLDFWAIDAENNIWVGPAFYDGRQWTELARDEHRLGGSLIFEERVAIDTAGQAWVPYRIRGDCPATSNCDAAGLAAFDREGRWLQDIELDLIPELMRMDLPWVRFEQLTDGSVVAVGARALFLLPSTTAQVYPGFEADPATGRRNPGYVAAAATRTDGGASFFPWIEPLVDDPKPLVTEAIWSASDWSTHSLNASPLFDEGGGRRFVTAAGFDGDGALWVASSAGELAMRQGNRWLRHFTPVNSPLGAPIHDLAVDIDNTVWVGTATGLRKYEKGAWQSGFVLFLPHLNKNTCPFGLPSADC